MSLCWFLWATPTMAEGVALVRRVLTPRETGILSWVGKREGEACLSADWLHAFMLSRREFRITVLMRLTPARVGVITNTRAHDESHAHSITCSFGEPLLVPVRNINDGGGIPACLPTRQKVIFRANCSSLYSQTRNRLILSHLNV